ncbi:MAG: UDP-3-O-(3-hydroxymyristoyl)glucosamine N-acyltransferase [Holosporales bacterium]|jgi:UDP-3-O-[3-hydroxymyristoyl] glucosamine N-acyltransferase|nr:UDP-3-O-(3-hydroxymyristoyl)glucosamine N-acyltransferase [Holosporales bacterium]
MVDTRFYGQSTPHTVRQLADMCGALLEEISEENRVLFGISTLKNATPADLSFLSNTKYLDDLRKTHAGAVFVVSQYAKEVPSNTLPLIVSDVLPAYGVAAALLYPSVHKPAEIHPTAQIDPSASIGDNVSIGAYSTVEARAGIGAETVIGAHTAIHAGVIIGKRGQIADHVTLSQAIIGDDVRIHAGARIGEPGFGIVPSSRGMVFIPQLGRVLIGDRVSIGANTTIDRGSIDDTVVGNGTIVDNLVQIAHNVHIGKNCTLVAQVGLAGSCSLGNQVVLAGKVGVAGHVHVGNNVTAAAKTGITHDITDNQTIAGFPAEKVNVWRRQVVTLRKLSERPPDKGERNA